MTDLEPAIISITSSIGCAGVVAVLDPRPVAAQVSVRPIPGIPEVHRRSMAVSSVAGLVWQAPRRACRSRSARVSRRAPGRRWTVAGSRLRPGWCSSDVPSRRTDGG